MSAEQLAQAESQIVAAAQAATPALEKLKNGLAENRASFASGKISAEQYRSTIATLPGSINGAETDQQAFNRVMQETQSVLAGMSGPTAKYEKQLDTLSSAFARGIIDDEQYAAATQHVRDAMAAADPAAAALAAAMERGKSVTQANLTEQEKYDQELSSLSALLSQGAITQETFTRAAQAADPAVKALNDAMARGASVTQANLTEQEKYEQELASLQGLLSQGAITQETFNRAVQSADPAVKALNAAMDRGKSVTQANLTATERYDAEMADLRGLVNQGAISQETFARASKKAEDSLNGTVPKAQTLGQAFGNMPGPIGAAARALDQFGGGLKNMMAGFSGGFGAGLKTMFSDIGGGLSNAFSSGGASLLGIAPQIAVIGAVVGGAVAAISRLTGALGAVGAEVERTQQLATRLGVSFQEYEVLGVAAKNAGVDVEALAGAQTKFLKAVSEARGGAEKQVAAFAALGFSQQEIANTNPNELLEQAAKKLNAIEDPATRAALSMKLFGKSGNDVLPALAAIDATRAGIARLGGTMSQVDVERFSALDDSFDNVGVAGSRLGKVLLTPFTELFTRVGNGLAAVTGGLAKAFAPIGNLFAEVGGGIGLVVERMGEGIGYALRLVGALGQMSGITVIASAIGAAVDQWGRYFEAVDSFIEPMVAGLEQVAAFVSDNILRGMTAVYTIFGNLVAGAVEWVGQSNLLSGLFSSLTGGAQLIGQAFAMVGGWVTYVVEQLEYWAGIEPKKMTSPEDKEAIEEQMAASKELAKQEEENQKKAEQRAATIKDDILSPYEKLQQKMTELNDLEQRGLLTAEQRAAAEAKVRDEFAKQDPIAQAAKKTAEEQKKASEDITKEIEKSAQAGKELGAAGQAARDEFAATANAIKSQMESGLIDPEQARKQMAEATDAMNEELKRVGEDVDFAKKMRESMQTEGEKVAAELKKIDDNKTLSPEEKEKAKAQVKEKAAGSLPGGEKSLTEKFRDDQKKLQDAFDNGVIDEGEFKRRAADLKKTLNDALPGAAEKTPADKFREDQKKLQEAFDGGAIDSGELDSRSAELKKKMAESLPGANEKTPADKFKEDKKKLQDALDAGAIDPETFKERVGNLKDELESSVDDVRKNQEGPDRRANQAVDVNSSEGASTFFRLLRGQDDPTKKQLKELEKQSKLLASVDAALREEQVVSI